MKYHKTHTIRIFIATILCGMHAAVVAETDGGQPVDLDRRTVSLSGTWQMRMDPACEGTGQAWFQESFEGEAAMLPGTVDTNASGPEVTSGDLMNFTPRHPYAGCVWYQREVEIPRHGEAST